MEIYGVFQSKNPSYPLVSSIRILERESHQLLLLNHSNTFVVRCQWVLSKWMQMVYISALYK